MVKCQKDPTGGILLKRGLFKDIKNYIPICQTRKYKKYKYKIHKCTNTAYGEVPERPNMWYIFEKRIIQWYKNDIPVCQTHKYKKIKYTNTQRVEKCQFFYRDQIYQIYHQEMRLNCDKYDA